jgi:hypothetical protein
MTTIANFAIPDTLAGLLILVVALVILWAVISLPVYVAGKLVTEGKASFGDAMGATLGGGLAYLIILWGGTFFLSYIMASETALVISFVLALIVWVAVYGASFDTSWLGGLAIAIVGFGVLIIADIVLVSIFGVGIPKFYPW